MDPITIALGLAQIAPSLMRFFGVGDKPVAIAEKAVEIAQVVTGQPTGEAVRAMVDALDELPKPMLGYCRSGNRSTIVYQQTAHLR